MGEVIEFNSRQVQRTRLKNKLLQMIDRMDDAYEEMDDLMAKMSTIGEGISVVEESYSNVLREYARLCDKQEIETRLLSYSKTVNVKYDADAGTIEFVLADLDVKLEEEEKE